MFMLNKEFLVVDSVVIRNEWECLVAIYKGSKYFSLIVCGLV